MARPLINVDDFLAIRKDEGLKIDPSTAEVDWGWGQTLDPYGVCDLPEEYQQVQRHYFARAPGSDVWVEFGDLPEETRHEMWRRLNAGAYDEQLDRLPFD